MLKIRNLIFALSFTPLMSFAWQLPSLAQSTPSVGTAGIDSGAPTAGTTPTIFSAPPAGGGTTVPTTTTTTIGGETVTTPALVTQAKTPDGTTLTIGIIPGVENSISTSLSTDGNLLSGDTIPITPQIIESTLLDLTITNSATPGQVNLTLTAERQAQVNQVGVAIIQNPNSITDGTTGGTTGGTTDGTTGSVDVGDITTLLTGGADSQQAAEKVRNGFTLLGATPGDATGLVTALNGLFSSTTASLPNQPVAMTTSGQLVASTKAFKPVTIIAQGRSGIIIGVNINKLNDAIFTYNKIVLQSKPEAVKNLSNNTGFRGIGGILKQLRTAIK